MHRLARLVVSAVLIMAALAAQAPITLPNSTGTLTASSQWVALGQAELEAPARATDPSGEPARLLLLGSIEALRRDGRTTENVLLHMPGSQPGQIRLLNAYSAEIATTSAELQSQERVEQIRNAVEAVLAQPGMQVVYHGQSTPPLFDVGCLQLTFRVDTQNGALFDQFVIVPAGERLQYFETKYAADDLDASVAIAALVQTFDGAAEAPEDNLVQLMLFGGATGAIAGIAVAMMRRRRQERALRRGAGT